MGSKSYSEDLVIMECPTEIKDLLKVLYNLSSSESEVLYYLCDEDARASEIAEDLGKDRSTVQRYLSKLRTADLVNRESKVEKGKRGRYYVYSVPDKEKMKNNIRDRMKDWEEEKLDVLEEI